MDLYSKITMMNMVLIIAISMADKHLFNDVIEKTKYIGWILGVLVAVSFGNFFVWLLWSIWVA